MSQSAHGTTLRYLQGCQDITRCQRCTAAWLRWCDEKDTSSAATNNAAGRHGDRKAQRAAHCPWGHTRTPENTLVVHDVTGRIQRRCLDCKPHLRQEVAS